MTTDMEMNMITKMNSHMMKYMTIFKDIKQDTKEKDYILNFQILFFFYFDTLLLG
jgi:hypothetical protein